MPGPLEHLLALQAEAGGALSVERYMREALYHPEFGYYARNIRTVGRRGDFATSASLGEALGTGIAQWLWRNRVEENPSGIWKGGKGEEELSSGVRSMGRHFLSPLLPFQIPRRWHVIEAGAGTGELARTVLRRLGPLRRLGLTYHIVETSPVLREEQRRALPQFRVHWHESMNDALAACGGRALIFSNELIDAFPCRLYERRGGQWVELGVRIERGRVFEGAIDREPIASSALTTDAPDGQRIEVHASAAEWLATWTSAARHARMLTIDYGDVTPDLYRRRPRGSLRAYFHHQRYEGAEVYHRFGKQDLTADVNFTDLRDWTERCGWRTLALNSQAEFLATHGGVHAGLHDAQLADHTGAGAAFKVLVSEINRERSGEPPSSQRLTGGVELSGESRPQRLDLP